MVVFAELRGATTLTFLENTIKVAQVIEPTSIADFGYRIGTIHQHTAGITQSLVDNILT